MLIGLDMVYIIYGAPCSGKTTYVKSCIKRGDIVCDLDSIYSAITEDDPHNQLLEISSIAKELNNKLLDIISERKGNWKNAYIICANNSSKEINALKERVKADECIFINTSYEVCIERAKERPFYFSWIIEKWFGTTDLYEKI